MSTDSWWSEEPDAKVVWTVWCDSPCTNAAGRGKSDFRMPSRLWLYKYPWSTLKAAGEGRARGRMGR